VRTLREALAAVVREIEYHWAHVGSDLRLRDEVAYAKEALASSESEWVAGNGSDLPLGTIAWVHDAPEFHMPYTHEHPMRRSEGGWNLGMFHFSDRGVTHYMVVTPPAPPSPTPGGST